MKQLNRYLSTSILQTTLIVFLIFLGMRLMISLLGEIAKLSGNYTVGQSILFSLSTLIVNMYQLFPPIALLGALLALGNLASSSELTVMRVSGVSMLRLSWLVIQAALIMILGITMVSETIGTKLALSGELQKANALSGSSVLTMQYGIWLREENDVYHIGARDDQSHLTDITRYQLNDQQQLQSVSHAQSAVSRHGSWHFYQVTTSDIGDQQVKTKAIQQVIWPITLQNEQWLKGVKAYEVPLPRLYDQITYLKKNSLNAYSLSLSLWSRLLQPITTLIMILLSIPFIFGPLRSVSTGLRILSGVLIGLGFFIFNRVFAPFSVVYQLPPLLAACVPILVFALIAMFLIKRIR